MALKENSTHTDQNTINKELDLKTEDLQWLLNSMLSAFVIFDPVYNDKGKFVSYRFVHINTAYEDITGVRLSKVKGKTVHEIWPETESSWVEKYGHVSTTGETLVFDNYHGPTKKHYHCRVFCPWKDSQRFCVIFTDITEQKHTQAELERNEERYRMLIENLSEGIGYFDLDGRVILFNKRAVASMGGKPEDFIGKSMFELYGPEVGKTYHERILATIKSDTILEFEDKVTLPGGTFWFKSRYNKIYDDNGSAMGVQVISTDITKNKETELQLNFAKNEAERYLDLAGNMILTLDREANIALINQKGLEILGYSKEELLGQNWFDTCIPEQKREDMKTVFSQIIKGRISQLDHYENEVVCKNGEIKLISWYNTILRDDHDRVISALSSGTDITEQKRAEKILYEQKNLLDSVIDQSPIPLWISDKNGVLIRCNQSLLDTLNVKESDIIGTYNILNDANVIDQGYLPLVRNVFEKKHTIRINLHWKKTKSGIPKNFGKRDLYLDATLFPICDTHGNLQNVVCKWIDITESVLTHQALIESEERFELAMKASQDGLYDWDLVNNEIYFSPGWKKMLGYEYDELPNDFSIWETLTKPEDVKRSLEMQQKVINKELDRFEMEFKMKHKDGHWVNVLSRAEVIFDENGKAVRMIGTHVNISERKRFENDLLNALNKAQESDRLKSAFLANMSHEIRTPMNGILGFSGLLKQADLNSEKQLEYIDIIERSGKRMLNTINDLIDISKIESGQLKITNKEINFNELLNQLYSFFKPEAETKGLNFIYEPALEDNNAIISTDEEKLFAIMSNYLKNAVKYTHNGSIHFGYHVKDGLIEFFVKDSGIGISKEKHAAVFERFVQADLSITKPYEGSGLGLAISKAYAEMIGAKVRVESEPGKGSVFYLSLPLNHTRSSQTQKTTKNGRSTQTKEKLKDLDLLIVEDDEASVLYLKILLEKKCNSLRVARTGGKAIELVKDHPEIDLILMDVRMPDMDGYTATEMIRKFNKDVLIIAQTAYAMESDWEKAIKAGCNEYISKPIREEVLFSTIKKLQIKKHK